MQKIKDILNYTETFAPLDTQMDFDNSGLLIGSIDESVSKVLLTLDITNSVVEEAVKIGAELILSHHPVIFAPLKKIEKNTVVYNLIKNEINALCLHTNLDLGESFGVNTCLADAVGVKNYKFVQDECLLVGELGKEMTTKEFAEIVKISLSCKGVRFTNGETEIKTIAICSGSGGDYVKLAKQTGADLLLTGEIKHNQILTANEIGLSIIDASHYKSEDIVITPLLNKLQQQFPDLEFIKSKTFSDKLEFI